MVKGKETSDPGLASEDEPGRVRLGPGDESELTCSLPRAIGETVVGVESLRHNKGNAATVGIWRVRGDGGSAVLKVSRPPVGGPVGYWPTSDEPTHWNYWRREFLAYTTELATTSYAEAGITAPRLVDAITRDDGKLELWLDDVDGTEGFALSVRRLACFAYELGVGQARWAGRVPDSPWLSRRWLEQYLREGPPLSVELEDDWWDHPRVAVWPTAVRSRLRRLWVERDRMLLVAESGERTLCHLDVWPANLLADCDDRSVLLDWSFVGEGALGEDVANLVIDSFTDGLMDASLVEEVADTATEGYLAGLRDGGWTGSSDLIRKSIAACGAAKYSWLAPAVLGRVVRADLGTSSYNRDSDPDEAAARVTNLFTLIADWAARASA